MKVLTLVGTRPEIIKMAPLIELFDRECDHILIHSGQHYSPGMDQIFFEDLELRIPDKNLGVGSILPACQVAAVLEKTEEDIDACKPDVVVVHGDTNTTLGGALAAAKYRGGYIPLVHIEAGARSGIRTQVEEVNRKLVDQLSSLLFAANPEDSDNLLREGIESSRIFITGNTVLESCRRMADLLPGDYVQRRFRRDTGSYAIATLHRQESVDNPGILNNLVCSINSIADKYPLIIPLHPRTKKRIKEYGLELRGTYLEVLEPLGYRDMVALIRDARLCLTDSGGVQEEAAVLDTPALVLREKTEHMKYIRSGYHRLCPPGHDDLFQIFRTVWDSPPASSHALESVPGIAKLIFDAMQEKIGA